MDHEFTKQLMELVREKTKAEKSIARNWPV